MPKKSLVASEIDFGTILGGFSRDLEGFGKDFGRILIGILVKHFGRNSGKHFGRHSGKHFNQRFGKHSAKHLGKHSGKHSCK